MLRMFESDARFGIKARQKVVKRLATVDNPQLGVHQSLLILARRPDRARQTVTRHRAPEFTSADFGVAYLVERWAARFCLGALPASTRGCLRRHQNSNGHAPHRGTTVVRGRSGPEGGATAPPFYDALLTAGSEPADEGS